MAERKKRLGIIVDYLTSEYTESLMLSVQKFCIENNLDLLFFTVGELFNVHTGLDGQNSAATTLVRKNELDGLIITAGTQLHGLSKEDFNKYLQKFAPIPIVTISESFEDYPSIVVNCEKAYEQLIGYLVNKQNCKKIGILDTYSKSTEIEKRRNIIRKVLRKNKIPDSNITVWESNLEYGSCYSVLLDYFNKNDLQFDFDAIISINDDIAYACIDFVNNHTDKKIPEDIAVVGFDDLRRASFSNPGLTSINQQVAYQGYIAAETLLKIIDGEKVPSEKVIEAKAVIRESSERIHVDSKNFPKSKFIKREKINLKSLHDKYSVYEWYKKRSQIYSAAKFGTDKDGNVLVKDLPVLLTEELQSFGFQSAVVVLYNEPVRYENSLTEFVLPSKAKLMGFDYKVGFNSKQLEKIIEFNPQEELIPENYITYSSEGSIVSVLYHDKMQYGYVVLGCCNNDVAVYELISRSLGSQIAASYGYSKLIQEQDLLHDRYQRLDIIANSDELTGLRNRRGLTELGTAMLNFSEAMGQTGLIIYCDMDGLKIINDTYGHDEGDIAIKAQAKILAKTFRSNDVLARIAGDEFAIISPGLNESNFNVMKENIDQYCEEWSNENKKPYRLSISLGAAKFPDKECEYNLTDLLIKADMALYKEKTRRKSLKSGK